MGEQSRNPVEELAEEFVERYRRGERPAFTEYTQKHPELAEDIREVFPALVMIEEAGPEEAQGVPVGSGTVTADGRPLEQLGDYHIVRQIGRGGMGVVYEAVQEALGRHVALKVLPFAFAKDSTHLKRFRREARSAARLHHTNIVPVFDIGESRGIHYYAMQFIQGQGMDEVLQELQRLRGLQHPSENDSSVLTASAKHPVCAADRDQSFSLATGLLTGQFRAADLQQGNQKSEVKGQESEPGALPTGAPASDNRRGADPTSSLIGGSAEFSAESDYHFSCSVARVGLQVAEALAYAHGQKVLHRDIKPSNLLLDLQGTVWVTDFGLAKEEEGEDLTRTGDIVGTLRYMAPERFNGFADSRSDIYSLGMTLYELLTLRPAFEELDRARLIHRITRDVPVKPRKLDAHIPRDLETIVCKTIAKEPRDRYATAEALAEDFRRFLSDRPIRARRTSMLEQGMRWCRRNRLLAGMAASILLLLVFLTVGSVWTAWWYRDQLTVTRGLEDQGRRRLYDALLSQARASRFSRRLGQRYDSIEALTEATKIARELEFGEEQFLELRNEAIACLALLDLRRIHAWNGTSYLDRVVGVDEALERYVRVDDQGKISIRRVADNQLIYELTVPENVWNRTSLSPDGRFLHVGSKTGWHVWRLGAPELLPVLKDATNPESCSCFSPDSRQIAIGHRDASISLFDLNNGELIRHLPPGPSFTELAFHPRKPLLALAGHDSVQLRDLETGAIVGRPLAYPWQDWPHVRWRPDGQALALASIDQSIYLWEVATSKQIGKLEGHKNGGVDFVFSHDGNLLASICWDGMLRLWDPRTGKQLLGTRASGRPIQFSPDDSRLATGNWDKLEVWKVAYGKEYRTLIRDPVLGKGVAGQQAVSPDLDRPLLVTGTQDGLEFSDPNSGRQLGFVKMPCWMMPLFDPSSSDLLTGSVRGVFRWPVKIDPSRPDLLRFGPPQKIPLPGSACQLGCSRDGRVIANPQYDRGAAIFHADRPEQILTTQGGHADVRGLAVDPDGRWIASASHLGSEVVKIWEAATGHWQKDLPSGYGGALLVSPDGRWLVTSGDRLRVWRVGTWEAVASFQAPRMVAMAFSPDSRILAFGRDYGTIHLVDPETEREYARLEDPDQEAARQMHFTPDGAQLVVRTDDSYSTHVWDLRSIRLQLIAMGLDWDLPAYEPSKDASSTPSRVEMVLPEQLKIPNALEAEDLKILDSRDCRWAGVQEMGREYDATQWSGGRQLFCSTKQGGYVDVEVELGQTGDYQLDIYITRAPDFGKLRVFLDGKEFEKTFDAFNKAVVPAEKVNFGKATLTKGAHTLRFQAVDKNPQSSNYYMGIDCIVFTPITK